MHKIPDYCKKSFIAVPYFKLYAFNGIIQGHKSVIYNPLPAHNLESISNAMMEN